MSQETIIQVTAEELEKQIFEREGICVILRCPRKTKFDPWPYARAAQDKFTLAKFRDERLIRHLRKGHSGSGVEFMIIGATFKDLTNAGRWKLSSLRSITRKSIQALRELDLA
jgi:hypothetical protein